MFLKYYRKDLEKKNVILFHCCSSEDVRHKYTFDQDYSFSCEI